MTAPIENESENGIGLGLLLTLCTNLSYLSCSVSRLLLPPDFISTYCVIYKAVINFYINGGVLYILLCIFFSFNKVS